jgi:hypothetical protein
MMLENYCGCDSAKKSRKIGHVLAQLVDILRYKPEGRSLITDGVITNFILT